MSSEHSEAGISVLEGVPTPWVEDVVETFRASGVVPRVEIREPQVLASIEWLMPTAALLYLTNRYVGTLVSEAAKEHYPHIRRSMARFAERVGTLGFIRMASSPRKLSQDRPGNLTFALVPENGAAIRFMFPGESDKYPAAITALFVILEDAHRRESLVTTFWERSERGRLAWRLIVRYSDAAHDWVLVDPISGTEWPI
jgi:hypothetical protein